VILRMLLLAPLLLAMTPPRLARADDLSTGRLEHELASVMKWETLWKDSPEGFRTLPNNRSARLALYSNSRTLSYCSHDLAVCVRYRTESVRNWERLASKKCQSDETDQAALMAFVAEESNSPPFQASSPNPVRVLGPGGFAGLAGSHAPGSGMLWDSAIALGSRADIAVEYRQTHVPEMAGLLKWLRATMPRAGYTSIRVPCFAPFDPVVYIYGAHPTRGPLVFSIFWDREGESWVEAALLEGSQNVDMIEDLKSIIDSVTCSTLTFK
jgi:hypothetical protein